MYDDDGLNFRSTIDKLYTVQETIPSHAIKNSRDRDESGHSFHDDLFQSEKKNITKEARDKYKQVANLDTRAEIFHVNQVMTYPVLTVDDSKSVSECFEIMKEHNVQQLPVMADNKGHVKGMITLVDILKFLMDDPEFAKNNIEKHISEISTKKVITTDPISDIRRVSKVMSDFNLNAIPVVNTDDELVGIVSRNDILKAVANIPHLQIWA